MNDKLSSINHEEIPRQNNDSHGVFSAIKKQIQNISKQARIILSTTTSAALLTSCTHLPNIPISENSIDQSGLEPYSETIKEKREPIIQISNKMNNVNWEIHNPEDLNRKLAQAWKIGTNNYHIEIDKNYIETKAENNKLKLELFENSILANELGSIYASSALWICSSEENRPKCELLWDYATMKYLSNTLWNWENKDEVSKVLAKLLNNQSNATEKYSLTYELLAKSFEESFVWIKMTKEAIYDVYIQAMWYTPKNNDFSLDDIESFFTAFEQNTYDYIESEIWNEEADKLRSKDLDNMLDKYIPKEILIAKN